MGESVTRRMADFSANLKFEDLPDHVVQEVKRLLLDTVACGLGGHLLDKGRLALEFAREEGGTPQATVVGRRDKLPASMAAFVNGELMNALDYCALQPPAHVTPYVVPPALTMAEVRHATGKDLIAALAVAHEMSCRVADSLGNLRATPGGLPLKSFGVGCTQFGATAGAARIMGLDAERMAHALGLAGYHAPVASHVKYNHTIHVGMAKYGPSGWAAQAGIVTARLAEKGYRGDATVLDGDYGFWAMNGSPACDWDKLTVGLGENWSFEAIGYKYWPCCGSHQAPLDCFDAILTKHDLKPDDIEKVVVRNEGLVGLPKYNSTDIEDHVEAASSLPYNIAVAAHRVPWGPQWQAPETLAREDIRAFAKRVSHEVYYRSEECRYEDLIVDGRRNLKRRPAQVEVFTRGTSFVHSTDYARWMTNDVPESRASDADLVTKFKACAQGVLTDEMAALAAETILNLENVDDVATLMEMLAGSAL
ncbi:MmgE/PrpD family protein [Arthrobacter sp. NPDC057009]|uniref:MmgE/PrpD family protein n=1 Tax=Arthrobacter sp. NPDC057009 TaxID=3345996 RepID=UPI003633C486